MSLDNNKPIISVNHLTCTYGKKVALSDASIEVVPGRVFGLVGENGAGKTTLIKHLLGALTPQSGHVSVFGVEPSRDPVTVLSQLGYLSEDRDLPRWMKVSEFFDYTKAFFPDWDDALAEDLRKQFDLPLNTKIKSLSRGEKAKAGLAAALAHRPKLLLLDEPSSGLDAVARREILGVVIRSVAEEGRTVVFSSHLLDEVERVVDDVAMIYGGRVTVQTSMDELKAQHQRRVVSFDSDVDEFPRIPGILSVEGQGKEWSVQTNGDPAGTRAALESAGARIIEESTPSLDAIFVAHAQAGKNREVAV